MGEFVELGYLDIKSVALFQIFAGKCIGETEKKEKKGKKEKKLFFSLPSVLRLSRVINHGRVRVMTVYHAGNDNFETKFHLVG